MQSFLIVCRLEPAPPDKLPPWGGLLDVAEEHGLWWLAPDEDGLKRLPEGTLWGRFERAADALAALDTALSDASELLGYELRARRRIACPTEAAALSGFGDAQKPFAQAEALLYLSYQ